MRGNDKPVAIHLDPIAPDFAVLYCKTGDGLAQATVT